MVDPKGGRKRMKFSNTSVMNFENAFRGLRNPMNSWSKSDSHYSYSEEFFCKGCTVDSRCGEYKRSDDYIIGKNDMKLAQTLIKAGNEHRKFMRQIFISVDITAPIYWWKEFDTYKVGTTVNSTSTMHKLATTPITLECFEIDDYDDTLVTTLPDGDEEDPGNWTMYSSEEPKSIIDWIESLRLAYLETKDKRYWKELIRWLPESWLQTRTVTMNYENVRNMYFQRKNHKLTEWSESFIKWVESLPYAKELIMYEG